MTSDDLINHKLGKGQYEIRSVLGRGGMAAVYLARQASMNRDVAIKVMTPELADDEQFVSRFEHEAKLIAQLQHPHILPVIDFGREGKHIFIVMQLVRGGSLDDRLHEGPLPLRLAARMLNQIGSALTFAHEQGIIHRDLKPNNVMLDERNNAYLVDFGIAKMLAGTTKLTATGNILGTPAYMAPEQWRGEPVDARTDIYSLGIMVYEMVLGRLPFSGDTPFTLMYKHFNDPPPAPRTVNPDIDPAVEGVILRALAKDADDRFQSADQLAEEFNRAVQSIPAPGVGRPAAPSLDKTVIGDEIPGGTPPPPGAPKATPRTAWSPEASVPGARPAGGTMPMVTAPPARRGLSPLVIGGAVLGVIAIIAVVAVLALGGGDDGKKAAQESTPTETSVPTDTPEPTNTPTDTPEPTARTTTATILAERANVRSGPGTEFDVAGSLARDDEVVVLGISEDQAWYLVAVPGVGSGWVSAEIVRITGNPNIPVIIRPTDTPVPTDTPTETPEPTDTPVPTDTPTNTPEPTNTPVPTEPPIDTPVPTVAAGIDPALLVPAAFAPITLDRLGLTFDYPSNWPQPTASGAMSLFSPVEVGSPVSDQYPTIAVGRGTPEALSAAGLTSYTGSLVEAVEHPFDADFAGLAQPAEGYTYPGYILDSGESSLRALGWIFEIKTNDWLYIFTVVPESEYTDAFANDVLGRMVRTMVVDGIALAPTTVTDNTETLTALPLQLGTPVLDRFDDNTNDWQFGSVGNSELTVESPELDYLRWSYPNQLIEGDPAFYSQITGRLTSQTNYYQIAIAFRVVDGSNFYYYTVDHAQQFALYSMEDGNLVTLFPPAVDNSIQVGTNAENTLGVLVIGDYIEIYLNGLLKGAIVDRTHDVGGARPATYTYVDSNTPVIAAFDDYAYVPLNISGHPDLIDQRIATVAIAGPTGSTIVDTPKDGAAVLALLPANQPFVALARTVDNQYIYGYARGATGWIKASSARLEHGGESSTPQALPMLDSSARGEKVGVWPVVWPEDRTSTGPVASPTPPAPGLTVAYGQTVSDSIDEGGSDLWLFSGVSGDLVTIAVTSSDSANMDLMLNLLGPDTTTLAFNDDDGPGLNPLISNFRLPASGLFTIQVDAFAGSGSYQLTLTKN